MQVSLHTYHPCGWYCTELCLRDLLEFSASLFSGSARLRPPSLVTLSVYMFTHPPSRATSVR